MRGTTLSFSTGFLFSWVRKRCISDTVGLICDRYTAAQRAVPTVADSQIIPKRIRITNPLSGAGITSRKSAKEYVRRGLAVWIGTAAIEMLECRQRISARLTLDYSGYDRAVTTGLAHDRAMVNVPITRPDIALQRGQRSYGCGPLHRH